MSADLGPALAAILAALESINRRLQPLEAEAVARSESAEHVRQTSAKFAEQSEAMHRAAREERARQEADAVPWFKRFKEEG